MFIGKLKVVIHLIALFLSLSSTPAEAQFPGLTYPQRFFPYQGWSAIARGDTNTIGMSGATVALPNSISAVEANPAGLAMTLGGLSAQINSYSVSDPDMNRSDKDLRESQFGLGTSMPPWGYGLTYYSPKTERVTGSEVSVRQLRFGVARLINKDLSFGMNLELHNANRNIAGRIYNATKVGWRLGLLYKLEDHWIIGASYVPGINIGPGAENAGNPSFGFNQSVLEPHIFSIGMGYMPNRFFKAGASLQAVGATPGARMLYDQNISFGEDFTLQPRIGASYILFEYTWIKGELAAGSYYETSRVEGTSNRLHGTFGLEVNPWFVNTGIGGDFATHYKNLAFNVGVDIVRTLRHFKVIPLDTVPFYEGKFPPINVSADGLPDGFTVGEEKTISPPSASDIKEIVEDIPERVEAIISDKPSPKAKKSAKKLEQQNNKALRNTKKKKTN